MHQCIESLVTACYNNIRVFLTCPFTNTPHNDTLRCESPVIGIQIFCCNFRFYTSTWQTITHSFRQTFIPGSTMSIWLDEKHVVCTFCSIKVSGECVSSYLDFFCFWINVLRIFLANIRIILKYRIECTFSFTLCKRKGAHIEEKLTIRCVRHPPVSPASPVQQGTRYRQLPSRS